MDILESSTNKFPDISKDQLTKVLIEALDDLGFYKSAEQLRSESQLDTQTDSVTLLKKLVKMGDFSQINYELLDKLPVSSEFDKVYTINAMLFLVKRQMFLEILFTESVAMALVFLRSELSKYATDQLQIRELTNLLTNPECPESQESNGWKGSVELSREDLNKSLCRYIDPECMVPQKRLFELVHQALEYQKQNDIYYTGDSQDCSLFKDLATAPKEFPKRLLFTLTEHFNEVWYLTFSNNGKMLASTSSDCRVIIYDVENDFSVKYVLEGHDKTVMHCAFSPDDNRILTCGMDLKAKVFNLSSESPVLERSICINANSRIWCCDWLPEGDQFILGSPDKEIVWFDALTGEVVHRWVGSRISDLKVDASTNKLVTMTNENTIEVWDLETKNKVNSVDIGKKLTCISISTSTPGQVLTSVSPNEIQLWDYQEEIMLQKYVGQRQSQFMIRSCFGMKDRLILSGSEDGKVYIWNKKYGSLVTVLNNAHTGNCNTVAWSPTAKMFVSGGDDNIIKVWGL